MTNPAMRIGVFEVTKSDGDGLQPMAPDGRFIPDHMAGCLQAMAAEETSVRGGVVVQVKDRGGHIALAVPSIDVLNISKVVRDPSEYGLGSRILMKTGWFGGGVGGKAQKYVIAKLGEDVAADLKKLNDGRFCCLLASIINDDNQAALSDLIHKLAAGQSLDIGTLSGANLSQEDRQRVEAFVFSKEIKGKAAALQQFTRSR